MPIEEHPLLAPPLDSCRQNLRLDIAAFRDQLSGRHGVIDTGYSLLDDGTLVQIRSDKVRRGADDLDAAVVRLVCESISKSDAGRELGAYGTASLP